MIVFTSDENVQRWHDVPSQVYDRSALPSPDTSHTFGPYSWRLYAPDPLPPCMTPAQADDRACEFCVSPTKFFATDTRVGSRTTRSSIAAHCHDPRQRPSNLSLVYFVVPVDGELHFSRFLHYLIAPDRCR